MLIALFIGLSAVAILAVCLKRRHVRKVDERRAALSGLPAPRGGSSPDIGHGRDMWGPHQHMAHTGGWDYTTEQDREMRQASAASGGGVLGGAIDNAKPLKGGGSKKLDKKRHDSQRSARHADTGTDRERGEYDENTRMASPAVRRSRSERRAERERERERDKLIERGLRGLPIKSRGESTDKEKQGADSDRGRALAMSGKEKDIS
jgi:hypothetical protein